MTNRQQVHAQHVVTGFRTLLEQAGASGVTEEHWKELALLVEGAIDTALLEELEPIADRMEALANEVRREAERGNRST